MIVSQSYMLNRYSTICCTMVVGQKRRFRSQNIDSILSNTSLHSDANQSNQAYNHDSQMQHPNSSAQTQKKNSSSSPFSKGLILKYTTYF